MLPNRGLCRQARRVHRVAKTPERDVVKTITDFAPLWDELFPAEQARIVRLLVERVDLAPTGLRVKLRAEGLQALVAELRMRTAA